MATLNHNLDRLAYKQNKLSNLLKKLDVLKKQIRAELFQEADEHYQKEHWLLPMTSWLVPHEFFEKTGMSREEFAKTRFPQWDVTSIQDRDEGVVFVIRKKKTYMPWSYASDELEISRSVAEQTPEVDWDAMEKADPEFFQMFAKKVEAYELDADAFNEYTNTHPEFPAQSFLVRYSKHKAPTLRVLSKQKKDE